ncbi:hypothetical protein FAES_3647 [Fibrella aestuarina BUZ 2]|uniref:Uncharacterized protein n=1 Tax=Fibrella aestuarina BUZ 2 TaxID=1166018 RepID=I0KC01_9BACT|nr:hypothetical protein [Fibrella aestuarina]CCH01654.1 hypothetical protein FAES_3647 [Fibrella aestuarina BUZ 2]
MRATRQEGGGEPEATAPNVNEPVAEVTPSATSGYELIDLLPGEHYVPAAARSFNVNELSPEQVDYLLGIEWPHIRKV